MIPGPLTPGMVGVDLDSPLDAAACASLLASDRPNPRIAFAGRYLGDLTTSEAEIVTGSGLGLLAVTHPRSQLDAQYGTLDGQHAVQRAQFASLPTGIHLFLDLESWTGDAIGYVNAWSAAVVKAGFLAGLYVGATSAPLTADELADLAATLYWESISDVPKPTGIGWGLEQAAGDVTVAGLLVDLDLVRRDFKGRVPIAAWATREAPTMPGRRSSSSALAAVKP